MTGSKVMINNVFFMFVLTLTLILETFYQNFGSSETSLGLMSNKNIEMIH